MASLEHARSAAELSDSAPNQDEPATQLLPADPAGRAVLAKFFRALGDPNRLRLLELLVEGERSVGECVASLGIAQSRVSTHLACLADCGFVDSRREGRFAFYRVIDPRVTTIVKLATSLAADNAAWIAACTRIDGGVREK